MKQLTPADRNLIIESLVYSIKQVREKPYYASITEEDRLLQVTMKKEKIDQLQALKAKLTSWES